MSEVPEIKRIARALVRDLEPIGVANFSLEFTGQEEKYEILWSALCPDEILINRLNRTKIEVEEFDANHAANAKGPVNCTIYLQHNDTVYPKSCDRCRLGPCPFYHDDGKAK